MCYDTRVKSLILIFNSFKGCDLKFYILVFFIVNYLKIILIFNNRIRVLCNFLGYNVRIGCGVY